MWLYRVGHFFYRQRIPFMPQVCDALIRLVHNGAVYSQSDIGKETVFGYCGIAVVLDDVPAYSVVVRIPVKVIKTGINPKDFY